MTGKIWALLALGAGLAGLAAFLCLGGAADDGLSERQRLLWRATRERLEAVYAAEGRSRNPMSREAVEALRVPLVCDGSKTGPLPWDVKLLLQFDQDLFIDRSQPVQPFLGRLLEPEAVLFVPKDLMEFIVYVLAEKPLEMAAAAERAFLEKGGDLPAVLDLSQIGGDELPGLFMAVEPGENSVVVHFDYDDQPEYYLRSLCLLEYVARYIDSGSRRRLPPWSMPWRAAIPGSARTDASQALEPEEQRELLRRLQPLVDELNAAMWHGLESAFSDPQEE